MCFFHNYDEKLEKIWAGVRGTVFLREQKGNNALIMKGLLNTISSYRDKSILCDGEKQTQNLLETTSCCGGN